MLLFYGTHRAWVRKSRERYGYHNNNNIKSVRARSFTPNVAVSAVWGERVAIKRILNLPADLATSHTAAAADRDHYNIIILLYARRAVNRRAIPRASLRQSDLNRLGYFYFQFSCYFHPTTRHIIITRCTI